MFATNTDGRMKGWPVVLFSILAGMVPEVLEAQEPLTLESMNRNVATASVAFSPAAPELAVLSDRSGTSKIWLMAADGSDAHILVRDDHSETSPVWSPNGDRIAFLRSAEGGQDVWTVQRDGEGLRRITHDAEGERALAWGPFGRRIAFLSRARPTRGTSSAGRRSGPRTGTRSLM